MRLGRCVEMAKQTETVFGEGTRGSCLGSGARDPEPVVTIREGAGRSAAIPQNGFG